MRFAWWINKATTTHSKYVIFIACPRQQWLHECLLNILFVRVLPNLFSTELTQTPFPSYSISNECNYNYLYLKCRHIYISIIHITYGYSKGKAVPLQPWSDPEGSRKLRFPDFMSTAQDGGKVVSLTHRPPLPPGNTPGTNFC